MMRWSEQQLTDYLDRHGAAGQPNTAVTSAPPFAVCSDIILDLPPPPSVNKTRKIDWAASRAVKAWRNVANAYVLAAKGRVVSPLQLAKISRFELLIVMSEHHTKIDLANGLKALINYRRKIELI